MASRVLVGLLALACQHERVGTLEPAPHASVSVATSTTPPPPPALSSEPAPKPVDITGITNQEDEHGHVWLPSLSNVQVPIKERVKFAVSDMLARSNEFWGGVTTVRFIKCQKWENGDLCDVCYKGSRSYMQSRVWCGPDLCELVSSNDDPRMAGYNWNLCLPKKRR